MEIKVERFIEEGKLVFKIICDKPDDFKMNPYDIEALTNLDGSYENFKNAIPDAYRFKDLIKANLFDIRSKVFERVSDDMTFSLRQQLEPKFDHMCQEIYNWQYDAQSGFIKNWLQEFDPQRVKYYFANDKTPESDSPEEEDNLEEDELFEGS